MSRCIAIRTYRTPGGEQCHNRAVAGSEYCYRHQPADAPTHYIVAGGDISWTITERGVADVDWNWLQAHGWRIADSGEVMREEINRRLQHARKRV